MEREEAYKIVFDELYKIPLFRGEYDAQNGTKHFMFGVSTVMENIAVNVSEECHDKFNSTFMRNLITSETQLNEFK